jgi:lipoate-protein ligase A
MARDHALASSLPPAAGVLRIYRWASPTLSFGRNEPVRALRDPLQALGDVSFVRRPTGGRTVLHDHELTYAVIVPIRALGGIRQAYQRVNEGLVCALRSLGVDAELGPSRKAAPPAAGPCFREAAGDEVVVDGRKLVGSAQVRLEGALLQHGSILLAEDQSRLDAVWPEAEAGARPTSLAEILGSLPSWERLTEAVVTGVRQAVAGSEAPFAAETQDEHASVGRDLLGLYRSSSWTWRR